MELLSEVTTNPIIEDYSADLINDQAANFLSNITTLESQIGDIKKAVENKSLFGGYDIVRTVLAELKNFESYEVARYEEIQLILIVSEIISNIVSDLDNDDEINTNQFELVVVDDFINITINTYGYENPNSFVDSVFFFTKKECSDFESYLKERTKENKFSLQLLFVLLSKIGSKEQTLIQNKFVLIKPGNSLLKNSIVSFLSLHILSDGLKIYSPLNYLKLPNNPFRNTIKVENKYQQFQETFNVFNEYNSSKDVLSKYLKLYQVIEDYMYKFQLVKLEMETNGRVFTLRDFKRMNEEVSEKEIKILEKFFNQVLEKDYSPHLSFKQFITNEWKKLIHVFNNELEIDEIIKLFRIKSTKGNVYKYNTINTDNIDKVLAQLIYYTRNSIVHNKTTEFHLTYRSLSTDIFKLLEHFSIPVLEIVIFFLTVNKGSQLVWFTHPSLKIWEDN